MKRERLQNELKAAVEKYNALFRIAWAPHKIAAKTFPLTNEEMEAVQDNIRNLLEGLQAFADDLHNELRAEEYPA